MPSGMVLVVIFPLAGRLSDRLPPGLLIGVGMLIFAYSAYLTGSVSIHTAFWTLAWWTVISRIGLGFVFPSLTAASLKVLPHELVGQGSGAVNFIRQLGGAFGVNLLAIFLERRTLFYADALTATQTSDNSATTELVSKVAELMKTAGLPDFQQVPAAILFLSQSIAIQANTLAFQNGFLVVMGVFLAALAPTWMLHRAQRRANNV